MADKHHVNFLGATSWENGIYYRLARPQGHVDSLIPILVELVGQTDDPGEQHQCPVCNNGLWVEFAKWKGSPNQLHIQAYCAQCNVLISFESDHVPDWAKEISIDEMARLFSQKETSTGKNKE